MPDTLLGRTSKKTLYTLCVAALSLYAFYFALTSNGMQLPTLTNTLLQEKGLEEARQWNMALGVRKVLPHVIIAGVKKCGTQALSLFLDQHDHVVSTTLEPHFFDRDETYAKGFEWYRNFMPESTAGQLTLEKTPKYFVTEKAAKRIHHMNSAIRLIFVVREPVYRMVSDYLHDRRYGNHRQQKFEDLAIDKRTGNVNETSEELQTSIYHIHLAKWLRFFDRSQIHILNGESLVKDPVPELIKVERFLGLENQLNYERFRWNEKRNVYCIAEPTHELCHPEARQEDQYQKLVDKICALFPEQKCLPSVKGRPHPKVQQDVWDKLCRFFQPHNELFFQMIGERFSWKCSQE